MDWDNILSLYRSKEPLKLVIGEALRALAEAVPCQACSIFVFDEYGGSLNFFYGTNTKESMSIPLFRSDTSIWKMFNANDVGKIDNNQIKGQYPSTDVFFENVSTVESVAHTPLFDERSGKIGVIRLLNRIDQNKIGCDFLGVDLIRIKEFGAIIGAILTVSTLRTKYEAFLDSVTHELLAPISGIKNSASFLEKITLLPSLREDLKPQGKLAKKIEDILRFSEHAITLIQGLTMYTKSGRMTPADLDLRITNLFRDVIQKSISNLIPLIVSRGFNPKIISRVKYNKWPLLKIDRKVFIQVFNNLLSNCIKYAHDDPEAFNVNIELDTLPNGNALIVIQDYGIGLQKNEVPSIFDPTFRGRSARAKVTTGTGIGLTTVKNLLNAHECKIEVTNLQNPTEFSITIPSKFVIRRDYDIIRRR